MNMTKIDSKIQKCGTIPIVVDVGGHIVDHTSHITHRESFRSVVLAASQHAARTAGVQRKGRPTCRGVVASFPLLIRAKAQGSQRSAMGHERPVPVPPQNASSSTRLSSTSSQRETVFFNPSFRGDCHTPGLTPNSQTAGTPRSIEGKQGVWSTAPPPPACLEAQHTIPFSLSPRSWFHQNLRRRGPWAVMMAVLIAAVLFFVSLGVRGDMNAVMPGD